MTKIILSSLSRNDWSTFARLEIQDGDTLPVNCGTFTIRNLDFDLLTGVLLMGCRKGHIGFEITRLNTERNEHDKEIALNSDFIRASFNAK